MILIPQDLAKHFCYPAGFGKDIVCPFRIFIIQYTRNALLFSITSCKVTLVCVCVTTTVAFTVSHYVVSSDVVTLFSSCKIPTSRFMDVIEKATSAKCECVVVLTEEYT